MSDRPKKVSIVIPTFNQAEYLHACVSRCLCQTYPRLEIIIVDGGSTDGTKDYLKDLPERIASTTVTPISHMDDRGGIVRKCETAYPQNRQLHIMTFDSDIGPTRTYNEGLKRATGDYCTYVVGDDLPFPHMVEELVHALEARHADFVYSDMDVVDDSGAIVRQIRLPGYSFKKSLADWYYLGVSHLYKTSLHEASGLMDETHYLSANDYDHYLRFAMDGARFVHVPKILYSVRHHGDHRKTGQHTHQRYENLIEESRQCARRARAFLMENNPTEVPG